MTSPSASDGASVDETIALRVVSPSAIRASSGDARPFAVTSPPVRYKVPSRLRRVSPKRGGVGVCGSGRERAATVPMGIGWYRFTGPGAGPWPCPSDGH